MPSSWSSTFRRRAFLGALAGLFIVAGILATRALVAREEGDPTVDANEPPATVAPSLTAELLPTFTPGATPTAPATAAAPETAAATASAAATETPTSPPTDTPTETPTPTPAPTDTSTPTPQPLPTPDGVPRRMRVPILMYHYLSAPPPGADAVRRGLSVSPEQFEQHLRYLREAGYETISLHDLALALQIGHPLPEHPIVLTFDDGYRDNYERAFPLLRAYGYTATFFLITGFIDDGNEAYVTWDQVVEMHEAGMEIEAHGHTHPDLRGRDVDYLVWQVLGAKEAIEARTGEPVRFFCYPSGKYDDLVIRVLHSAHYWGAVTVSPGVEHASDGMFELSRVRVPGDLTAAGLAATLNAYMRAP